MYCLTGTTAHAQRCPIVFFLQCLCAQLRQKISSIILSCHPAQNTTAFFFSIRTAIYAAWHEGCLHAVTVSRGWHTNTGNKSTVTKRNSSLSSLQLWGEKKRKKKRKRHCIRSTLTSSLPLLMSSLVAADRLLCGINRIFLLIQIWQASAIGQW